MLRYLPALLLCSPLLAADPPTLPLWEQGAPGFEDKKDVKETRAKENKDTGEYCVTGVHNPYVTVFLPPKEKATGAAVVVVPGGGHRELWVKHEGENIAQWLSEKGIAAVVLSLATGPHRVQDPQWQDATRYRLELAERWVDSARRMSRLSSSA